MRKSPRFSSFPVAGFSPTSIPWPADSKPPQANMSVVVSLRSKSFDTSNFFFLRSNSRSSSVLQVANEAQQLGLFVPKSLPFSFPGAGQSHCHSLFPALVELLPKEVQRLCVGFSVLLVVEVELEQRNRQSSAPRPPSYQHRFQHPFDVDSISHSADCRKEFSFTA